MADPPLYEVGFYEEADGSSPVFRWITEELSPAQRRSVTAALEELVARMGPDIVRTDFGKNLGGGIIELRIRQSEEQLLKRVGRVPRASHPEDEGEDILLRIFFHPHGQKRALVLHGYDKGKSPSKRHQQQQIAITEKRLALFKQREKERARAKPKERK
jgi:phage-related protein